jgi:DNA-3-methyladenine glycosylase II
MHSIPDLLNNPPAVFDDQNFQNICNYVGALDEDLKTVLDTYSYPPMWTRPNNFQTLVHIILEQQVSLASALAALNKLIEKTENLTPAAVLDLTDEEMRACYVSRQKTGYIRGLALALQSGAINLKSFEFMSDDEVREKLISLKGIGNWTIDVYLMFALRRNNIFPIGDLAAVNALKRLKGLPASTSREEILEMTKQWEPFKTIACMILWHFYLSRTSVKIAPVD